MSLHIAKNYAIERNYTPFTFVGYNQEYEADLTITDVSTNIKLLHNVTKSNNSLPSIYGGTLYKQYVLDSIDFRWDSTHEIDDVRYPLEVQIIHHAKECKDAMTNPTDYRDGVAILSTFYMISKIENDDIKQFLESIPNQKLIIDTPIRIKNPIIPRKFLTRKVEKYYQYNGSLKQANFPDCVVWTLFSKPSYLTANQLNMLKRVWTEAKKCTNKLIDVEPPMSKNKNIYFCPI